MEEVIVQVTDEEVVTLTGAIKYWLLPVIENIISTLNFQMTINEYTFGLLDFLVISFLLGLVIRNFVHSAR